jgi:hypothetical protein
MNDKPLTASATGNREGDEGATMMPTQPSHVSRDRQFVEKLTDAVGLYLHPPEEALVLCVDEESRIQAPERTPKRT